MKVILAIDSVCFPLTGIGRYTVGLASALQHAPQLTDLKYFAGWHFLESLPVVDDSPNLKHQIKSFLRKSSILVEAYHLLFPFLRKQALKHYDDYLYHGPNFSLPPFPGLKVATFHDLSPFIWSQCSTPERVRTAQKEALNTIANADALITGSEFTRQEIAQYFNWPIERIHVIPLACSEDFKPRVERECQPILAKYHLNYQRYSLYVGTIEPRKNIIALLDAYSTLPLVIRRHYPLILTGYQGWNNEDIFKRIHAAEAEGWARYLGYLPVEELPVLFSGAKIFCFPSLYEGFGLPVLEAMSSGVPVVCSNASSLPEVIGEVGLMCESNDIATLSNLLLQALENIEWRAEAIGKGLERSTQFSWPLCAERTIKTYEKVIRG